MTRDQVLPLLEGRGLSKTYRVGPRRGARELRAVDGVDIAVAPGETLGIVGESGSGKSTLARLLLRLEDPTAGAVLFDGQDVTRVRGDRLRRLRRDLQAVFQDVSGSLDPKMTVAQLLAEPLRLHHGMSRAAARARALGLLETVRLSQAFADRYPYELSGGQRQRVSIARALAANPRLIVLDEPVSALDVSTQAQIVNLLEELQRVLGLAYVFIAHDLYVVHHVSHRIAVMYLGAVVESGPTGRVLESPSHPYTRALLDAIPDARRPGRRKSALGGEIPSPLAVPAGCRFHTRCPHATDICREVAPPAYSVGDGGFAACHLLADDSLIETAAAVRTRNPSNRVPLDAAVVDQNQS
ncbi:MAG TPA: ABC transporter ATP-binding protein [Acidimicrobiales bacterium]